MLGAVQNCEHSAKSYAVYHLSPLERRMADLISGPTRSSHCRAHFPGSESDSSSSKSRFRAASSSMGFNEIPVIHLHSDGFAMARSWGEFHTLEGLSAATSDASGLVTILKFDDGIGRGQWWRSATCELQGWPIIV
jgi:hypothetical protein